LSTASRPSNAFLYVRPSLIRSVTGIRSRNASATRESNAGYTIGVFLTWRREVGEFRPSCGDGRIGGREERLFSTMGRVEIIAVAADIDIERSWAVRSRRDPDIFGIVRADSDDRRDEVVAGESTSAADRSG